MRAAPCWGPWVRDNSMVLARGALSICVRPLALERVVPQLPRLVAFLLKPLYRLLLPRVRVADPWQPSTSWVALSSLGSGVRRDFGWYLDGQTTIHPKSIEEICDWLAG